MLKYAVWQWEHNKKELEEAIRGDIEMCSCDYQYIIKLVVRHILNGKHKMIGFESYSGNWSEEVDVIDHGDYQGTLIYAVHNETYQPSKCDYLFTAVEYGSCSGCDTLLGIQGCSYNKLPTEEQVKEYMMLCKDLVTGFVHPFKSHWLYDDEDWGETTVV